MSDVYSLDPKWSEWHAPQGITCSGADEEAILQNICVQNGFDWEITVTMTDVGLDEELGTADDVVPTGYVRTESAIRKHWGWSQSLAFVAEPVLDVSLVWTGEVKLTLPASLHSTLGIGVPWSYQVRVILDGDTAPDFPVKVMAGYLVVKP